MAVVGVVVAVTCLVGFLLVVFFGVGGIIVDGCVFDVVLLLLSNLPSITSLKVVEEPLPEDLATRGCFEPRRSSGICRTRSGRARTSAGETSVSI